MDINGISGIDQGYKLLRGSREEEGPAANHGKKGGGKAMRLKGHAALYVLPGFSPTSKIMKAYDSNLAPFHICTLKTIQYGDTSIPSICTDDPKWSAGECIFQSKYEGRFRKKPYIISSKVKF